MAGTESGSGRGRAVRAVHPYASAAAASTALTTTAFRWAER